MYADLCKLGHCAANGVVQLNEAAQTLGVPKRRLYDITNVLEGIDMVEKVRAREIRNSPHILKIGKNSIRWKSVGQSEAHARTEAQLAADIEGCDVEEMALDAMIDTLSAQLQAVKTDPLDGQYVCPAR